LDFFFFLIGDVFYKTNVGGEKGKEGKKKKAQWFCGGGSAKVF